MTEYHDAKWELNAISDEVAEFSLSFAKEFRLNLRLGMNDDIAHCALYRTEDNELICERTTLDKANSPAQAQCWASTAISDWLHNEAIRIKDIEKALCGSEGWKKSVYANA